MSRSWDAIVVGGGPAGCAASTILSRWGRRVLLIERERFPRYHPGESLAPASWKVFDAMGVGERVAAAGFVLKSGSTFVWGPRRDRWSVYYGPLTERPPALQVRRDELDHLLLRHASDCGVAVREGCRATGLVTVADRVVGVRFQAHGGHDETAEAPWLLDASGTNGFVARRLGLLEFEPDLANAAAWGYWEGGGRLPGRESGNTLCTDDEHGMTWHLPLDDRTGLACVGALVLPAATPLLRREPRHLYQRMLRRSDVLSALLDGASQVGPFRVAPAGAYCASRLAGPGWLLLGDAACFVDPVIAGGVQLALHHAVVAAVVANTVLEEPGVEVEAAALYDRTYRQQYDAFARVARNVYRPAPSRPAGEDAAAPVEAAAPPGAASQAMPEGLGDRVSLLSLVSGLPVPALLRAVGEHIARRGRAAERGGAAVTLGEEEGFAFLTRVFHAERLATNRARRVGEELGDDSVVRLAPGAALGAQLFLPPEGGRRLVRRRAAANRYGDRFQLDRDLERLLSSLDGGCPCSDVERRLGMVSEGDEAGRVAFRRWLEVLADQALIEWHRPDGPPPLRLEEDIACAG